MSSRRLLEENVKAHEARIKKLESDVALLKSQGSHATAPAVSSGTKTPTAKATGATAPPQPNSKGADGVMGERKAK